MRRLVNLELDVKGVYVILLLIPFGCTLTNNLGANHDSGHDAAVDGTQPTGSYDECGNGMDDDGDGEIDEGCPCVFGETQTCFNGTYPNREIGACTDGQQTCNAPSREFGTWGECLGDTLPSVEVCDDDIDNDCDGAIDEGCPCAAGQTRICGTEWSIEPCSRGEQRCHDNGSWGTCEGAVGPTAEVCDDEVDNDCDGVTDEGCGCDPVPEVCDDDVDNDCDDEIDEEGCLEPVNDGGPDAGDADVDGGDGGGCDELASGIVDIEANLFQTCARHGDGRVFCWGGNAFGGLGIGDEAIEFSATPLEIVTDTRMLATGGDSASCVFRPDGMMCWGRTEGGTESTAAWSPFSPPAAEGILDVAEITVGLDHYLMRRSDGTIWGWGNDSGGALGDGEASSWSGGPAVQALTIDDAVAIDGNAGTVCAVRGDGSVWCWGHGAEGQCGPPGGLGFRRHEPHPIDGISDAVDVQTGTSHACALRETGEVVCWGMDGTRGDGAEFRGDTHFTTSAAPVPGLTNVVSLVAGSYSNCAILEGGELWCWGMFQTWDAPDYRTPNRIDGVNDVVDVAVGALVGDILGSFSGHLCVLERCGRVRCWGRNDLGQNGDGTTDDSPTPVDVIGLP